VSTRRHPAAPGHRPRAGVRFASGFCAWCEDPFIVDRAEQPWARARTCSESCAKRLANLPRHSGTCRHCEMVEGWRLAADSDLRRIEVAGQDEDARPVTFREWLTFYEWEVDPDAA
jgi:hypothetical protein